MFDSQSDRLFFRPLGRMDRALTFRSRSLVDGTVNTGSARALQDGEPVIALRSPLVSPCAPATTLAAKPLDSS
jgi:hypothetical protein